MKNFYAAWGYGPWTCYFCGKQVTKIGQARYDGNVHHINEDVTNDEWWNLAIGHTLCHQREHSPTEELKRQISAKLKGRPSPTKGMKFSAEVNARKSMPGESNPFFGRQHDAASLAKMRCPRKRVTCPDCGHEFAVNWINRHKQENRCVR